jgi:hypothetical protein
MSCAYKTSKSKNGENPGRLASTVSAGQTPQHIGVQSFYRSNVTCSQCSWARKISLIQLVDPEGMRIKQMTHKLVPRSSNAEVTQLCGIVER